MTAPPPCVSDGCTHTHCCASLLTTSVHSDNDLKQRFYSLPLIFNLALVIWQNLFPLRPFLTRFPRTGPMLDLWWIFIFLIFKGHDFQILSICRYFFSPSTSSSVLHLSGYLTNLRLHHAETCQVFSSLLFANHYSVVVAYKYWIEIDHSRPLKFFLSLGPWKQNIMK